MNQKTLLLQSEQNYHPFSLEHILVMVFLLILFTTLIIVFRKAKHEKITLFLKITAIIYIAAEIAKDTYSYVVGGFDSLLASLPFYICSIFLMALPFAAFGKGIVKKIGLNFIITLGIVGGFAATILPTSLYNYPVFSFYGLHGIIYHMGMIFIAAYLLVTGYAKINIKEFLLALIPVAIFAVPAIILNHFYGLDYMNLNTAIDTPFFVIRDAMPLVPFIFVVFLIFAIVTVSMGFVLFGIEKLVKYYSNKKKQKSQEQKK